MTDHKNFKKSTSKHPGDEKNMTHDVFISYSSNDKTVADAVCATLESKGIRCWIAPRDVPPGQSWAGVIIEAISNSKVFVLVFSDGSNKSNQVTREVGEAVDNGIPIVPLRIEDVEPSREMRYYIKSIHWLDAMTPPLEQHLGKLAASVDALLSVGEGEQPRAVPPLVEVPLQKRRSLPTWVLAVLIFAAVGIVGGGIWYASSMLGSTPAAPEDTSIAASGEATEEQPLESTTTGWSEWRTLSFSIPNETLWRQSGENSYTIIANPSSDTIAWSDEIISGDFILTAEVTHTSRRGAAMFIVYGDGIGFSYGCLMAHYGSMTNGTGWAAFEAHSIYGEGNILVSNSGDFYFYEAARVITIEITGGKANLSVDGQKVVSTFLPSEINHSGRIGLLQHWEQPVGATYSNIRIKTLGDNE
jgi:hypothetical protein